MEDWKLHPVIAAASLARMAYLREPRMSVVQLVKPKRQLKMFGTGRVVDNPRSLMAHFSDPVTDNELRYLDEVLKRAVACMPDDLG